MRITVCSVFDSKAKCFSQPFFTPTKAVAVRAFSDQANDGTSQLFKHPEDFTLYCVGYFDDENGRFENVELPEPLGIAANFKGV